MGDLNKFGFKIIESNIVPEGDVWAVSKPSHEQMCEVCRKRPAVAVLGSALGAFSRAFCAECAANPNSEQEAADGSA